MPSETLTPPEVLSFDVFGTLVDWRKGALAELANAGVDASDDLFERLIDYQADLEKGPYRTYREITAASFVDVAGVSPNVAEEIAARVGLWPLFEDTAEALRRLRRLPVRLVAITNSDRMHGNQVQEQLGFKLHDWICAEDLRLYKPDLDVWKQAARRLGIDPSRAWWHVSAYADYDLDAARQLGLTLVLVRRPHFRETAADLVVGDLLELARVVEQLVAGRDR